MEQISEEVIRTYEDRVDRMEDMFYTFMFNSDPLEIIKLEPKEKKERKKVPPEAKLITKAALLELCGKTLRRSELVGVLSEAFHRRKVLEVVAIMEQLDLVRVLYRSGDESVPNDQDIIAVNKNLIITATSSPALEKMLSELREVNHELELALSSILKKK